MKSILVTASEYTGMECEAVELPVSSDSDYRKVLSLLRASHARIVGFIDEKHCIWAGNSHEGNVRPVFAVGNEQLNVNGPLLVTGYDQAGDRMIAATMTEADMGTASIQYSHMAA